jgi:hypothetical protein
VDSGARGDANEDAFLFGEAAGHGEGFIVGDLNDLVDELGVEDLGDEAGADALDLVRAGLAAGEDGAVGGFHGDGPEVGVAGLHVLADPGEGSSGADAGDEDVGGAVGVVPDFWAGGIEVDLRVGGVVELLEDEAVGGFGVELFGLGDGALHAVGAGGENDFGTEGEEQDAALDGHGVGHGEGEAVAFDGGGEGEADAGVAAGGLDEGGDAGGDFAVALGGLDHSKADAVFDAGDGVVALELEDDAGGAAGGEVVELDERRVADEVGDAGGDIHGRPFACVELDALGESAAQSCTHQLTRSYADGEGLRVPTRKLGANGSCADGGRLRVATHKSGAKGSCAWREGFGRDEGPGGTGSAWGAGLPDEEELVVAGGGDVDFGL